VAAAAAVVAAVVAMAVAAAVMEHQAVVAVVAMAAAVAVMEHQAVAAVVAMAAVAVVTEEEVVSAAPVPAVGKIAATATVIQLHPQPQLLPQIPGVLRPLTLVGVNPAVMVSMMAVAAAVAEGIAPPAQHPVKIGAITAALRVNPKSELDLAAFQCFGKPLGCFC
jgi:hypothetical protein